MADEDDFPPYGPVPEEKRRPLRHWKPEGHLVGRPMLSQPVPSYKPLNRSTAQEKPERAADDKNRLTKPRLDAGPTRQRMAPPDIAERLREIDEEEANRLNPFDGYNPVPPRPRDGPGLQLRSRSNDINEYFTGPEWHDPRGTRRGPPYLEVAETRPIPPPVRIDNGPYKNIGEKVERPRPPPPVPVKVDPLPEKIFAANRIRFKKYSLMDSMRDAPMEFLGNDWLADILLVVDYLRKNPDEKVRIRASAGGDAFLFRDTDWGRAFLIEVRTKRADLVARQLKAYGVDPKRISTELGTVTATDDNRVVDFIFDGP